ncbi:MAG: ferrochelatase [Pirellulales bacterium]|nr:ferrochelatase [Pirellulales bacterium]
MNKKERIAVVLFNLGGPDKEDSVRPFLFNLFNDPAIISVPNPIRYGLAKLISKRRAPIAREIYEKLGGGSPLLANTEAQATALESALGAEAKVFIAMRYWHPFARETVLDVQSWNPDRVVLLPLYPQYSTTTTGSSLDDWRRACSSARFDVATVNVCCYPTQPGFIEALIKRLAPAIQMARKAGSFRVVFSAHGLPKRIVERGDPYQWQVERTAVAVASKADLSDDEWRIAYQSRVGPLEWIGPSTEEEIELAGREKTGLVIVPLAFVSEHSETLVELDIEYKLLAERAGVPAYHRVPTVDTTAPFIEGLVDLVRNALGSGVQCLSGEGRRVCPGTCSLCALKE